MKPKSISRRSILKSAAAVAVATTLPAIASNAQASSDVPKVDCTSSCRDKPQHNPVELRVIVRGDSMAPLYPADTPILFRRLDAGENLMVGRDYLFRVQFERWRFGDTFKRLRRITADGNLVITGTRRGGGKVNIVPRADVFWIGEPVEVRRWVKIGGGHA